MQAICYRPAFFNLGARPLRNALTTLMTEPADHDEYHQATTCGKCKSPGIKFSGSKIGFRSTVQGLYMRRTRMEKGFTIRSYCVACKAATTLGYAEDLADP